MWLERIYTGLYAGFSLEGIKHPTWWHILGWSNFRFWLLPLPAADQHWYGGYLGLSLAGMALAGLTGLFWRRSRRRSNPALAGSVCLGISLILVFGYQWPLIRSLPGIHLLASYRYLLFVVFFLAVMVGVGAKTLSLMRLSKKLPLPVYTSVLLVVVVDLGPTTFQHPYRAADTDKDPTGYPLSFFTDFSEEAAAYYHRGELPPYRIFWAMRDIHPYLALGRLQFTAHTPTPQAPHPGDLRPVFESINPLERYLSLALGELPETDEEISSIKTFNLIANALELLNVKYLLATQGNREIRTLKWPTHTPILVSSRISGMPAEKLASLGEQVETKGWLRDIQGDRQIDIVKKVLPLFWLVQNMGIDPQSKTCDRILLLDYRGEEDLGTAPVVELLDHRVWNQRVEMRVRLSAACFARLAYAYFPYLHVYLDGQEVSPLQTSDRFIALRLEAGEHSILLEPRLSPLRRFLLLLDGAFLVAAIWVWVREGRRGRVL